MKNERIEKFQNYMDTYSRSVYHAVEGLRLQMEANGYTRLDEGKKWDLVPGGKYYLTRGGSAILAFRIPHADPVGFLLSASHSDHPTFKIKENGELESKYIRLATEKYGGMLMAPWLDRPLSVAGRVLVETEHGAKSQLLDIDRDLLLIPNVAIHMNRAANDGYAYNAACDTIPLVGGLQSKGKLQQLLEETAGGRILGHDLFLYIRQPSTVWGVENEFLSSAALDDLGCAWTCTQGFLEAEESASIPVLCVFDSEEVGSSSVQGAFSKLLIDVLERICEARNLDLNCLLSQSFMMSADNAHAQHPNHPEYADANNAPIVNEGIVLKFNAALSYTTDGVAAAVLRTACKKANVPVQTFYNRADLRGGSTLGNISLNNVSVPTADIGLPQLAMHSCFETAGVKDVEYMIQAMKAYYSSTLTVSVDGEYTLN